MNLRRIIREASALGAATAMEQMGVSSGIVSARRGRDLYGKWFTDAVASGKIRPCRIENGKGGAHKFRVVDILAARLEDAAGAELQTNTPIQ